MLVPPSILEIAKTTQKTGDGDLAAIARFDATGFRRTDRLVGNRLEDFRFKLHLREHNEQEFYTLLVNATLRLDLAPENIALLKFYIKKTRSDPDYVFMQKMRREPCCSGSWRTKIGRCRLNSTDLETLTNTTIKMKMPDDKNNLMEGEGTVGLRVTLDNLGFADLWLVLGTKKDQAVRFGDTLIGYVENYVDVVEFFNMVMTPEKRERFGRARLEDVEVDATVEFVE